MMWLSAVRRAGMRPQVTSVSTTRCFRRACCAGSSRPGIRWLDDRLRLARLPSPKACVGFAAIANDACQRSRWPPMFREESRWDVQVLIGRVAVVGSHHSGAEKDNSRSTR